MKASSFIVQLRPGCFHLAVRAKPGARTTALAARPKIMDDASKLRGAAPPVDGKANTEFICFMQALWEQQLSTVRKTQTQQKSCPATGEEDAYSYQHYANNNNNKKEKVKKQGKKDSMAAVSQPNYADEKVRVTLVSGLTSRNKVLMVTFPGTEEDLLEALKSVDVS
ncbi:unnamed protein product [Trypanosoma congolense IL3000]|uniref:WGS project CAEQ00000000 data, annotated contig 531 n=1 Tax=Trypanosoma congolense (strain IL3000) TaxID=1068625 RepID=F9WGQ8_TRYCI|nr:unnamed protein product [Trypanosoma congolense IL3000]